MSLRLRAAGLVAAAAVTLPIALAGTASAAPAAPAPPAAPTASTPIAATAKAPSVRKVTVGSNPYAVAVAQNMGKAFVVNDGSVSVISLLTHRVLGSYSTGNWQNQNGIALMRSNTQAYITDNAIKTLTVYDTETNKVTKQIDVGYGAIGVAKANTPKGQRAYVITASHAGPQNSGTKNRLVTVQTSTGKVVARTDLHTSPGAVAASPSGKTVWVGSDYDGRILRIDTRTGKVTKTIKASKAGPVNWLAVSPNGKKLWVAGLGGISAVSTSSGKTLKYIVATKIGSGFVVPDSLAVSGSGKYVFAVNSAYGNPNPQGNVAAINAKTYKVVWKAKLGNTPLGIALDKTRGVAYVPNFDDDTVSYFSTPK